MATFVSQSGACYLLDLFNRHPSGIPHLNF